MSEESYHRSQGCISFRCDCTRCNWAKRACQLTGKKELVTPFQNFVGERRVRANPRLYIFTIALLSTVVAPAQERFSLFQPSTPESVARILKLANLRDDDVIVDHGIPEGSRRKLPWRAARTTASDYFAPIGVACGDV